jgi:hypothetical protein
MLKIRDDIGKFEENIHIPQDLYAINLLYSYITWRNHVCFRKYAVLERVNFRQNGKVNSKKHTFSRKSGNKCYTVMCKN